MPLPSPEPWTRMTSRPFTNEADPLLQGARSKLMENTLPSGLKLLSWSLAAFVAAIGTMFLGYGLVFS
jgi:hypothetical protein